MYLVQRPTDKLARAWQVFTSFAYLTGIFEDSVILAFYMYPLLSRSHRYFWFARAIITLADVIIRFFTAIPKSVSGFILDDEHDDP